MKYYYELTKSGLVFGNVITVIAGFLLGARDVQAAGGALSINFWLLFATLVGISLVMASGCVFNNYIDRDIDVRMERTKHRALVTKKISGRSALMFTTILGIMGFAVLALHTNFLAALAALAGFIFYVFIYSMGPLGKRRTVYGTFMGAVAGATPPVMGYAAASGRIDMAAFILFLIMLVWQMPHFFAIAIRREDDYAAAHIPVLPVKQGINRTKSSMLIYIVEFILAASLLTIFGYAGYAYLAIALMLGIAWLALCIKGFWISGAVHNKAWARQMFFLSLIVMVVLFITIAIGAIV